MTIAMFLCALVLAACSQPAPKSAQAPPHPAEPALPPVIASVAQTFLGADAHVVVFGDLARSGRQQALIVNRLPKTPAGTVPGLLVTRAVVAEDKGEGGKWNELFRCDEYLKNTNGFMGGTPLVPVTGWRLAYEQDAEKGLVMYYTPLTLPGAAHPPTIAVRWNPKVLRYQSLDRNFENFLGEVPSLERINSKLR